MDDAVAQNKKPRRFGRGAVSTTLHAASEKRPNYGFELRFFAFFLDVQLLNMLVCAFTELHMRAYRNDTLVTITYCA